MEVFILLFFLTYFGFVVTMRNTSHRVRVYYLLLRSADVVRVLSDLVLSFIYYHCFSLIARLPHFLSVSFIPSCLDFESNIFSPRLIDQMITIFLPRGKEKKKEIWLNPMTTPLYQQKIRKSKDNTQTPPKTSFTQRLRTDLGRSVGVTTVIQLVWLNRFTGTQPSH